MHAWFNREVPRCLRSLKLFDAEGLLRLPDIPLKVTTNPSYTLRGLLPLHKLFLGRGHGLELLQQCWNLFVPYYPLNYLSAIINPEPTQRSRWSPACQRFTFAQTRSTMENADSITLVLAKPCPRSARLSGGFVYRKNGLCGSIRAISESELTEEGILKRELIS